MQRIQALGGARGRHGSGLSKILFCVVVLSACEASPPAAPELSHPEVTAALDLRFPISSARLREHVHPAAHHFITSAGEFDFGNRQTSEIHEISSDRAAELALAAARFLGPMNRTYLERMRGARIDFAELEVYPRVFYAETPFEAPPAGVPQGFRNAVGSFYLVYMVADGEAVMSIAVSARATDAQIQEDGLIRLPIEHGAEFMLQGLVRNEGFSMPPLPEQAAVMAAAATGSQVTSLPKLVLPDASFVPQYARWRITLDRTVAIRGAETGSRKDVKELYVGLRGELSTPLDAQPRAFELGRAGSSNWMSAIRKPHMPLQYEPVILMGEGE